MLTPERCPFCKWCREHAKVWGEESLYRCANCKHVFEKHDFEKDALEGRK